MSWRIRCGVTKTMTSWASCPECLDFVMSVPFLRHRLFARGIEAGDRGGLTGGREGRGWCALEGTGEVGLLVLGIRQARI